MHFGDKLLGAALVHHFEIRRDAGLDGETAQNGLTESMDGKNAHAARRVENAGEKLTCEGEQIGLWARALQLGDVVAELALAQHRPVA